MFVPVTYVFTGYRLARGRCWYQVWESNCWSFFDHSFCVHESLIWLICFLEACEWYPSHWYPPHWLSANHYFHYSCRPSSNEKTGARRQMFGEVIDLRWEDCEAVARDGHVIALDSPQSPLTQSSHTLMSLVLFNFSLFSSPVTHFMMAAVSQMPLKWRSGWR